MYYFAYGSNLLYARMTQRVGPLAPPRVAMLDGYELRWHKRSQDGSGKCDIVPASGGVVHGAVYLLDDAQLTTLDVIEGVGHGYRRDASLAVHCDGDELAVVAYIAEAAFIDPTLQPYEWYHEIVVAGASALALPARYVDSLRSVRPVPDPDVSRAARERAILATADGGPA